MLLDCLFIHVPRIRKNFSQIMVLPSGLFSLADILDRNGISTRIIHFGLSYLKKEIDLNRLITVSNPKIIAVSLHWHYQVYDVIRLTSRIKKRFPDKMIVLGGYTASCFYMEIMMDLKFIDFIIRGDAEEPILLLSKYLLNHDGSLANIPNLVWRDESSIIVNQLSYLNDPNNTLDLCSVRIDLLLNSPEYLSASPLYLDFENCSEDNKKDVYSDVFHYLPGKGCPVNCSYCGGSKLSQNRIFNRNNYFFYDPNKVLNDLRVIKSYGISTLRMSFDPDPSRDYYFRLFERLISENLRFKNVFDCWPLPTKKFISMFKKTFTEDSLLTISPDCGSEEIRRKNKGFNFSNENLIDISRCILKEKMNLHIFFSYGLPFEKKGDLIVTKDLIRLLKSLGANCSIIPMYLDPFSPLFLDPKRYSSKSKLSCLKDFYKEYSDDSTNINYCTESLTESEILQGCKYLSKYC